MILRDLPGSMGLEVVGVDLRHTLDGSSGWTVEDIDRLRDGLDRRHLLVVREQQLAGAEQAAFVARFGPLVAEGGLWGYVSNVRPDGVVRDGPLCFHSDFAFAVEPILGISLHAVDLPAEGTSTTFADAVRAASNLPAALRARLDGKLVRNMDPLDGSNDVPGRVRGEPAGAWSFEHPVIGRHPRTGRPVVLANELHSSRIVGVPVAESDALLDDLFAVLYDRSHLLEHHWRPGDLLLWDNIALHHGRRSVPVDAARTLQRVVIGRYMLAELLAHIEAARSEGA